MISLSTLLRPNYSLFAMAFIMCLCAVILDLIYVPDTETLFVPFFFWEFATIFMATFGFVFFYETMRPDKENKKASLFHALAAFFALYVIISLFSTMKSLIHVIQPYELDEMMIGIERIMHFGFLPTTLIDSTLQFGRLYTFLDFTYLLWFFWMYVYASLVILGDPYAHLRERYLFTFAAVWFVVGNIAATLFASVGPIFLEDYFKPADSSQSLNALRVSADLFEAHSEKAHLFADTFKNLIMEYNTNKTTVDANASSAMPSVHVAMAALMMFHARHVNQALFIASILFFACIFIGSVLLAWHYAIDGYVALLLTFLLWKASSFLPAPEKPQKTAA